MQTLYTRIFVFNLIGERQILWSRDFMQLRACQIQFSCGMRMSVSLNAGTVIDILDILKYE